jgi:hypothetical protein
MLTINSFILVGSIVPPVTLSVKVIPTLHSANVESLNNNRKFEDENAQQFS